MIAGLGVVNGSGKRAPWKVSKCWYVFMVAPFQVVFRAQPVFFDSSAWLEIQSEVACSLDLAFGAGFFG